MLRCPRWFSAHDADEAGDKAAAEWPARAVRVRPPEGKDWTELWQSGWNRVRYFWGRHLDMPIPWEVLETQRWGPALNEQPERENEP
jgi:hypothetical protein